MNYINMDAETRKLMLDELANDIQNGTLYLSPRLTEYGSTLYPDLIKEAIASYDDGWLTQKLSQPGILRTTEQRRKPAGGYSDVMSWFSDKWTVEA